LINVIASSIIIYTAMTMLTNNHDDTLILGGGLSGLACGLRLSQRGYKVRILEKENVLGGLAASFWQNGKWIPFTYHHIMAIDKMSRRYLNMLDLKKDQYWNKVKFCFWFDKKTYSMTQPWDIFFFDVLTFAEKLKMLKFGIYCRLKRNWAKLEDADCEKWLNNFLGERTTNEIFKPLSEMEFGVPLGSLGVGWLGSRLRESARNRDRFSYITSGIHQLVTRLADKIKLNNGIIETGKKIIGVSQHNITAQDTETGQKYSFNPKRIISTIPPCELIKVFDKPQDLCPQLKTITYRPLICFIAGSRHHISDYYVNIFMRPRYIFGGMFNHTVLYPQGGTNGEFVYHFFCYTDIDGPYYQKSCDELSGIFLNEVRKICPGFSIEWLKIWRTAHSTPMFIRKYKNVPIKNIKGPIYYSGVYKEYPATLTMDTALKSGVKTAEYIIREDAQDAKK